MGEFPGRTGSVHHSDGCTRTRVPPRNGKSWLNVCQRKTKLSGEIDHRRVLTSVDLHPRVATSRSSAHSDGISSQENNLSLTFCSRFIFPKPPPRKSELASSSLLINPCIRLLTLLGFDSPDSVTTHWFFSNSNSSPFTQNATGRAFQMSYTPLITAASLFLDAEKPSPSPSVSPPGSILPFLTPRDPLQDGLKPRAQTIPYHILMDCFAFAAVPSDMEESSSSHGGRLVGWDSNEAILAASLVCRGWQDAAQAVLYKSVAIRGAESATIFLRTCRERPDLAERVKALVVGLEDVQESSQIEMGQAGDSQILVQTIDACPSLLHLQVRPLHESARTPLLAAITSKPLLSLVCAPRLVKPNVGWTQELYHATDIQLILPSLIRLELDFWGSTVPLPTPLPIVPLLHLVELRLHCDMPDQLLYLLLDAAGPTLEVVDLYFEHILSLDETAAALRASTKSMRKLRYISNPTLDELDSFNVNATPIFDRLLPHYHQLEALFVSATEVSTNLLRILPPSLKDLEVQSFNHHGTFVFSNVLLLALRDLSLDFYLETFSVYDAQEVWDEENVESVRAACTARGISFHFKPDSEEAESD